jgi:hypothetical protein
MIAKTKVDIITTFTELMTSSLEGHTTFLSSAIDSFTNATSFSSSTPQKTWQCSQSATMSENRQLCKYSSRNIKK